MCTLEDTRQPDPASGGGWERKMGLRQHLMTSLRHTLELQASGDPASKRIPRYGRFGTLGKQAGGGTLMRTEQSRSGGCYPVQAAQACRLRPSPPWDARLGD